MWLKNGPDERNEFTINILKWSGELFTLKEKSNKPSHEDYGKIYQKKFGHACLHRAFAITLWIGMNLKLALINFCTFP